MIVIIVLREVMIIGRDHCHQHQHHPYLSLVLGDRGDRDHRVEGGDDHWKGSSSSSSSSSSLSVFIIGSSWKVVFLVTGIIVVCMIRAGVYMMSNYLIT